MVSHTALNQVTTAESDRRKEGRGLISAVFTAATEFGRSLVLEGSCEVRIGLTLAQFGWFRGFICDDPPFLFEYGFVEGTDMRMTPLGHASAIWGSSGVGTGHGRPSGNNMCLQLRQVIAETTME